MCGLEFSDIEPAFWQAYRDAGLQVVGVNPGGIVGGDTPEIMRNFREQTGSTFPMGWATGTSYFDLLPSGGEGLSPFPLDVVIDQDGRIAYVSREYEPDVLESVIAGLLSQN